MPVGAEEVCHHDDKAIRLGGEQETPHDDGERSQAVVEEMHLDGRQEISVKMAEVFEVGRLSWE